MLMYMYKILNIRIVLVVFTPYFYFKSCCDFLLDSFDVPFRWLCYLLNVILKTIPYIIFKHNPGICKRHYCNQSIHAIPYICTCTAIIGGTCVNKRVCYIIGKGRNFQISIIIIK